MPKMLRRIFRILCLVVTALIACIQYGTTDARYMRDNLEYFSQRMEEAGLGEAVRTHGIYMLAYPKAVTAYELCSMEQQWVYGYLTAKTSMEEVFGVYYDLDIYSPNDALSRLVITTNNKCIQDIYNLFLLDEAETAKEEISEAELTEFFSIRDGYEETAYQAWRALYAELAVYVSVIVFLLTACISDTIVSILRKRKNYYD